VTDCHRDVHSAYDRRSKIRPQPISPPKRIPVEEFRTQSPRTSLSNALPLSGGRPSAADHPLQRLVGRRPWRRCWS
jgi:hypothetical protein